jgi:hypothetical protein
LNKRAPTFIFVHGSTAHKVLLQDAFLAWITVLINAAQRALASFIQAPLETEVSQIGQTTKEQISAPESHALPEITSRVPLSM